MKLFPQVCASKCVVEPGLLSPEFFTTTRDGPCTMAFKRLLRFASVVVLERKLLE